MPPAGFGVLSETASLAGELSKPDSGLPGGAGRSSAHAQHQPGGEDARAYGLPGACAVAARNRCPQDAFRTLTRSVLASRFGFSVLCTRLASDGAMSLTSNVRVEWIAAVTIAAGTAAIGYLAYKKFYVKDHRNKNMVNLHIQKDDPKVVHAFDMEDLGDKAVYCRCWRSKKFPFCDGAHTKHNEETGDNVGPLIIKRKET